MNLKTILSILALLAFLSVLAGGMLYYRALKASALKEINRQALARAEISRRGLASFLSQFIRPGVALAGMPELTRVLQWPDIKALDEANAMLDYFQAALAADVCYLMDRHGNTIASSNRDQADSFVGYNFNFRPYFKEAVKGRPATYLALGTTSNRRGAYFSHPVYGTDAKKPLGVAVIKAGVKPAEKALGTNTDEIILITGPHGVIFLSSRSGWLFHLLWPASPEDLSEIEASLQFGQGPWPWVGLTPKGDGYARDHEDNLYLLHRLPLDPYPGWELVYLRNLSTMAKAVSGPLIRITGQLVLVLCVLMGLVVFFLYQKASAEITRRRSVEAALRQSEKRYRTIYNQTPAMLHSIDLQGRLVSVSDHWLEVMGYERDRVIGQNLTSFLTPESRRLAQEVVFPQFFEIGHCKDVAYGFVKQDGRVIDVLLSAIGDRDDQGRIIRSLAVSIDVTERNLAEKKLKEAQEALRRHSRDLERRVRQQTHEIRGILKYTPDVVCIKDKDLRYVLVNERFESLFGVQAEAIKGLTDLEILPKPVAAEIRANDTRALSENRPIQVEETIAVPEGRRTYLSVRFPIFDEGGQPNGVCGISTDITPLKKARDQLRRLSGNILLNQEKERAAIARELHDELGQVLTALRMDAVWISERLKQEGNAVSKRALTMCEIIDKTIEEVRGIALRLRPGILDDLGLVDALEWYTADFERRTGIACIFEHDSIPEISDVIATTAYRVAQEALTNAARHADAEHVEVHLRYKNRHLTLTITDDGKGFNPESLPENGGLGIAGMQERANLASGDLSVRAASGKGVRVALHVMI